jgi:outer membrane receptor protein involved in Fe transport
LIVTAQKREEQIQDVPIAISAFTEKSLQEQKIEGGFDLLKAIPNVTFSKNNFSSYNFSIRGIGTKAISVTTDPGVAVEFNSTALIRNRLFEQEYFDVERVEVLRGPQGTLHGRNATAGVINVISAKPNLQEFSGWLKGEVGNYHAKRVSAMVNVPVIEDVLAVRLAGALTSRDGFDYNATTKHAVNGRDLWSARLTVGFQPNDKLRADFIWERFEEDDDRSRTGKQLCHHDSGPEALSDPVGGTWTPPTEWHQSFFSQGCKAGSLYDPAAFGTPNGLSMPFLLGAGDAVFGALGNDPDGNPVLMIKGVDPYGGMMQSPDLRVINSIKDPRYRAKTDVLELNADLDLTPTLTLTSQTAYVADEIYSMQDFNRFNTVPVFGDSSVLARDPNPLLNYSADILRGGIFCDPQIGCSDSIAGFDISRAKSKQFSQEFRLQSSFEGPLNFSVGLNYTKYETIEDYFVFFNAITLLAQAGATLSNHSADPTTCLRGSVAGEFEMFTIGDPGSEGCVYIDPNPIESINGEGHNYFRSKNPYKLAAYGAFGEVNWKATDTLKVTAGLRYNADRKTFTPVPSQTLLSSNLLLLGTVDRGYPALPDIKQHWGEVTGRLGVDWKPELGFTDDTMLYAFYSRGYKAGGANPPGIGFVKEIGLGGASVPVDIALPYPATFEPEFIDAFEVGAKNTLLGGAMTLNLASYYYDYKDYQVSQIKERTAVNENFDATAWGLELETLVQPTRALRLNAAIGYQDTQIADGEQSIDLMNRTQGDPDLLLVRPYFQFASSCVIPKATGVSLASSGFPLSVLCGLPHGGLPLNWLNGPNQGMGVYDQLGGNELPNAPHWTVSLGGQQTWEVAEGWTATVRADAYWQSQSWARVYNAVNDKLHGWYNANLSLWIENDEGLKIELYAKNILDKTPITDAFINSDDTALTTNVFVLDPRLIGLSIRKEF